MNLTTKTTLLGLAMLISITSLHSANILILESQSFHSLHKMDENWETLSNNLGHTATILPQTSLDNYSSISNGDVLIISSGLVDISFTRMATLKQFVENGGRLYIQSEYLLGSPGNVAYQFLVNDLGGSFNWNSEDDGELAPVAVSGELATYVQSVTALNYFWYGVSGAGGQYTIPFLTKDNKEYGFIFCPPNMFHGKIITTSDQDWIRVWHSVELMENILTYLVDNEPLQSAPTVSASVDDENPCPGEEVIFTANVTNDHSLITYQWLLNGSPITGAEQSSFTTSNYNDGDVYEVMIYLDYDCEMYQHLSNPILIAPIFALSTPDINIQASTLTVCENEVINFESSISNDNDVSSYSFQWVINGTEINGATGNNLAINTLNNNDEISLNLIYENACATGLIASSNPIEVNITDALVPTAALQSTANLVCLGEDVIYSVSGENLGINPTYQWIVNGSIVATGPEPTFTATNIQANQDVMVVVYTNGSCLSASSVTTEILRVELTQGVVPEISITADNLSVCEGESVVFNAQSINAGANPGYQWQINGVDVGNNTSTFESSNIQDGQIVSCIITADNDCALQVNTSSNPIAIQVNEILSPAVNIISDRIRTCGNQAVTFTANAEDAGAAPTYQWMVDGNPIGDNNPVFTSSELIDGQLISCEIVVNENCTSSNSASSNQISIQVEEFQVEVMEQTAAHCGLNDALAEIAIIGGVEPYDISWSTGGNQNIEYSLAAGTYTVFVSDASGCDTNMEIMIEQSAAPEIMEINTEDALCGDNSGTASLIMGTQGNYYYQWSNASGQVVSQNEIVNNLSPGIYTIDVQDDFGCRTTSTFDIEGAETFSISAGGDIEVKLGEEVNLEVLANSNDELSFEWQGDGEFSCRNCQTTSLIPMHTMEVTVVATNERGCVQVDVLMIIVSAEKEIYVPNAFSPNNDGMNDFFTAYGGNDATMIQNLKIFNRWGAEIFAGSNIPLGVEEEGWDGQYKGKQLQNGVYVYFLEMAFIDGSVKIFKGDISIMDMD